MNAIYFFIFLFVGIEVSAQQYSLNSIYSEFATKARRQKFDSYLRNETARQTFFQDINEDTEFDYESACLSVTQFQLRSSIIQNGLAKMFNRYNGLEYSTKRAFLATVYALYDSTFVPEVKSLIARENNPKLFAIEASYLYRRNPTQTNIQAILQQMRRQIPGCDTLAVTMELFKYLSSHQSQLKDTLPDIQQLFVYQQVWKQKTVYSFQRWNRDYPGLAIIQNEDGSFAKDGAGKLLVFRQLARAATNLPYFLTNGNTPQGVFSIGGVGISHNNIIGPTPNLQTLLPNEKDSVYWKHLPFDSTIEPLENYSHLLPPSWQNYVPMTEAFYAGKAGRSEIIVHGTTLDPVYFSNEKFYPISPTDGCLCARETWDPETGTLKQSDQLNLVNTFLATPDAYGLLMVINLDNKQSEVTREEIEAIVNKFEARKGMLTKKPQEE